MAEPLFTVENTFHIHGKGLAVVGIRAEQYGSVRVGDRLRVQQPDGSASILTVLGVEDPPSVLWVEGRPNDPRYGVVVQASDVPLGSVVTRADDP
jgi:hypothetical protein